MYLGLGLLYVGAVLVLNGIWLLGYIQDREIWVMNIFRAWKHLTFHIHAAHRLIHSSTWKVNSAKSGHLVGPGPIHIPESLCTTTTCSPHLRCVRGHESHPRGLRRVFYARSCKRTSENLPTKHLGA
jgi:hypothetical protein